MSQGAMAKKLLLKPWQKAAILNLPPGYLEALGKLPEGAIAAAKSAAPRDFVHLFVRNEAELVKRVPGTLRLLNKDGIFWISYPKESSRIKSDLSRDILWKLMEKQGYEGIAMISIDDNWTAMRFCPADRAGKKRKN